jgi:hypothetical protein
MADEDRYIRMGDEKWSTNVRPFEPLWKISQKGNPYLNLDVNGQRLVVTVYRSRRSDAEWTFSVLFEDSAGGAERWVPSMMYFVSESDAKTAALSEIGVIRRQGTSTENDSTPSPDGAPTTREPVQRDDKPKLDRRIRL